MKDKASILLILFILLISAGCTEGTGYEPEPPVVPETVPTVRPTVRGRYVSCPTPRHYESSKSDTIKVLLIGNSYAGDAVDGYMAQMLRAENVPYVVARLHYESCSVAMHLDHALNDKHVYNFLAIRSKGEATRIENATIAEALELERWTHISFQQVSTYSGFFDSLGTDLTDLMTYVSDRTCYDTRRIFYQTWAYGPYSTSMSFSKYGKSQMQMYNAIADVSRKIMERYNFDMLVPAGTAIQNARCTALGNDLTRDGIHLSIPQGRAIAGLVWCEALTGHDARENTFTPTGMTEEEMALVRESVHAAISNPYEITK